jgi:hypothetical protein
MFDAIIIRWWIDFAVYCIFTPIDNLANELFMYYLKHEQQCFIRLKMRGEAEYL